jgi:hypothetical protein
MRYALVCCPECGDLWTKARRDPLFTLGERTPTVCNGEFKGRFGHEPTRVVVVDLEPDYIVDSRHKLSNRESDRYHTLAKIFASNSKE